MATDRKPDALNTLRGFLAVHRWDYRAKLSGLDQTLAALDAAMIEQAIRQADIANAVCVLALSIDRMQGRIQSRGDVQPVFTAELNERLRVIFETGRDLR